MYNFDFPHILNTISIYVIPMILAITIHEAAHAYAAMWLGDKTAHNMGRTSLNPLVHIDPVGTLLLPFALYFMSGGSFYFGYAKPVPVIDSNLRNPAADMPIVALAGPVSNLVMALIWAVLGVLVAAFVPDQNFLVKMAAAGIMVNLGLFAFNMLPILPLDGGRVLMGLLPAFVGRYLLFLEQYGMFIVIALSYAGGGLLSRLWTIPVMKAAGQIIGAMVAPLKVALL